MNKERIARIAIQRIKREYELEIKSIVRRMNISELRNEFYPECMAFEFSRDLMYSAYLKSMARIVKVFETLGMSCEDFMAACRLNHHTQITKSKCLPFEYCEKYYKAMKWESVLNFVRRSYAY